ncbi:DUF1349 domain-containing protein [Streptomyces sp. CRN 30]|uniref:DUF1349 domain-containing protein n=1 Tax=Streptomyces sp. CRN 30 TaxID=3075613 RepID=UPI002A820AB2|nr:DUF1349 domain-containing protein [Streptomyces sp. CRN 30]
MTADRQVPALPFPLAPSEGAAWETDPASGALRVTARPRSDIFIDPADGTTDEARTVLDAVTLLGRPPAGDFRLSARVRVDFAAAYDAGVLLLWTDERHWAKLCFEHSPQGEPMVVSVVTRGVSDDANAFVVDGDSVWLRVSRVGRAFAYHASTDGTDWRMIRYFALDDTGGALVGFEAQSPTGEGCAVAFDDIRFTRERLTDLRDGS